MSRFRSLFRYFIYSNIFVSVAAVALTLETLVMQGYELKLDAVVFLVFFSTLFIYTVSRVQIIPGQTWSDTLAAFPNKFMVLFSFGCALFALSQVSPAVVFVLAPLAIISLGYALPLFRSRSKAFRLREIPMLKIFIISLVWGITTVVVPLLDKGLSVCTIEVLLILLRRMLYIFAITVPFDIRDQAEDAKNSLKTLPGAFGIKGAKLIAATALMLFVFLLFIQQNQEKQFGIQQEYGLPLILSSIVAGILIYKTTPSRNKYYYLFYLDGTMILQFLLVYGWKCAIFK